MDNAGRKAILAAGSLLLALAGCQQADEPVAPEIGPDGLMFSIENMDLDVDPRQDFYRFAAGGWLSRVERPADRASNSFLNIQNDLINGQLKAIVEKAVQDAPDAEAGTPAQLVGDFYTAYMDVDARRENGISPLQTEFERLDAVSSIEQFGQYAGELARTTGVSPIISFGPEIDLNDSSRYAIYSGPGAAGLDDERDVYRAEESAPRRLAYRQYVNDLLTVAGYDEAEAQRVTDLVLDLETELEMAKLTPAEQRDFNRLNNRMTLAEAQAMIPSFDIAAYLGELGLEPPEEMIVTQPAYQQAVSDILEERPLQDIKDYTRFLLINEFAGVLSPDFEEPMRALNQAFTGVDTLRPRDERALEQLKLTLGHPLSQLYVDAYYDEATRTSTNELIDYIIAAMAERIPTRDWLTEATRAEAMTKLEAFDNRVGYPENWIDYSGVEIGANDPVANQMAVAAFNSDRYVAKADGPVEQDEFAGESTLPVAMNAAYGILDNGFQITAAISQAPLFQPDADPAVRFCRFGAVIGHETTHGFDSTGRQFDANGNLRNWWTDGDAAAFTAEAQKLIDQTDSTVLAQGQSGNGALWVGENMADVGGITLAYTALMNYLADHPEENVEIDGFTQEQRCFIAWAQLWAENATEEFLINTAAAGDHPPNLYRTVAPLQHFGPFYEAFDIVEGDPMWLPPEQRVNAW